MTDNEKLLRKIEIKEQSGLNTDKEYQTAFQLILNRLPELCGSGETKHPDVNEMKNLVLDMINDDTQNIIFPKAKMDALAGIYPDIVANFRNNFSKVKNCVSPAPQDIDNLNRAADIMTGFVAAAVPFIEEYTGINGIDIVQDEMSIKDIDTQFCTDKVSADSKIEQMLCTYESMVPYLSDAIKNNNMNNLANFGANIEIINSMMYGYMDYYYSLG